MSKLTKPQLKRPDSFLVEIVAAEFEGKTQAQICEGLGITRQALHERIKRNSPLYESIKMAYYSERARLKARDDHQASK